jgi:hypothetical protein
MHWTEPRGRLGARGGHVAGPTISEFSFGYALTAELVNTYNAKSVGAPTFPSLLAEGKLGYDVAIPGIPVFLQFKLADHLTRGTAKEWHLFNAPYFRMHLYRRDKSDQHALLLALEASGEHVLYASPMFSSPTALNTVYVASNVEQNTAFWRPSDIGPLPDDDQHYVCYCTGQTTGHFCSEPREIPRLQFPLAVRVVGDPGGPRGPAGPRGPTGPGGGGGDDRDQDLNALYDKLVRVRVREDLRWGDVSPDVGMLAQMADGRPPILRVELAARVLFNSTLLFA